MPEPSRDRTPTFEEEVRAAVRYERWLAVKALAAIAVVIAVVVIRQIWLS